LTAAVAVARIRAAGRGVGADAHVLDTQGIQ
jgi:hypothetical protein